MVSQQPKEDGEMKKKALLMVLVCAMGLVALSVDKAAAAYYTCTISEAGSNTSAYYIIVSDTSAGKVFTDETFIIYPANGCAKEMYAAALTALANGIQVYINVDSPTYLATVWHLAAKK